MYVVAPEQLALWDQIVPQETVVRIISVTELEQLASPVQTVFQLTVTRIQRINVLPESPDNIVPPV